MGKLTLYARRKLVDHVCNAAYSPSATLSLALFTVAPTESTTGTEVSTTGTGYSRQSIDFNAANSRKVIQNGDITFGPATATAWGSVVAWAVLDASGNQLAFGAFTAPFTPVEGNSPSIASGQVQIEVLASSGSGFTTWCVNKMLDLMFNNVAWTKPATYVAVATSTLSDSTTSLSGVEQSGGSYARVLVNAAGWIAADSVAHTDNVADITFPTPSAQWSLLTSLALVDAVSAGNVMAFDNANVVDQQPNTGDTVKVPAGYADIQLN